MPVISRFDGIVVRMYSQQAEHNPPHIHALNGEDVVVVNLITCSVMEGELAPIKLRTLLEWIREHQQDLLTMWETQEFKKIE